ncbi:MULTISPECIES: DUF2214 family protein [Pseudomonas]|jgi:putative membrane protein|uniref:DUF2214 family protein n=1 Tax=Pseudomonas citronellolis TaxID=53408 RepID=A0AAW6P4I1_9PSED|nr:MULTISPECIES: DUF2214 family protein [Pseudomonas]KSW25668.1 hypothetical protein AOX63_18505 [Pseudomonas sp. ADP]AMO78943.1 hypothetical protein PcP3B5_55760 [Pseudomonas citronellolis]KES24098.1 membrane protein [Pseudomonas sp. AAC]KRV72942.1 hypothetical protein AO742_17775 [Pseudomonas citronellolis]KRW77791.1 hypothetical protein AO738_29065 [Pseudomonas citronellolis]
MASALVAYLHFISIFVMFALLVLEHRLFQLPLDARRARSLVIIDLAYGASAGVVLLSGIARTLWFAKGLDYYLHNAAFHALVGLFVLVALLSIYPTLTFLNWRNALKAGQAPQVGEAQGRRVTLVIRIELLAMLILPLLASLMAHGIGMTGS